MAMGIKRGKAEINVTPMIDVLLVLLIIFMVVQEHSVGLDVQLPQETDSKGPPLPPQDIMLTVLGGGKVRLD
jgi:biopolymer transport protein TolR